MKFSRVSSAAIALVTVVFAAGDGIAGAAAPAACKSLWVTAAGSSKPARARKPLQFSATDVLDLEFQVVVPAAALSQRRLDLKLFTPKGHLYQTLSIAAPAPSTSTGTPERRGRYQTLTARLPVAGTTIVNNSLYGTWKAEAYFEGDATTCARPRAFVIKP
jgi:hypothetical protein